MYFLCVYNTVWFSFSSEDVGKALINIIQEGKSGSIWVIENGPPAYEVEFPSRDEMYKKQYKI